MNTQRLLMIVLAINLMLSMSLAIYQAPTTINLHGQEDYSYVFGETINLGNYTAQRTENEGSSVTPENLQEEGTWGSSLGMGTTITTLFFRGLIENPYNEEDQTDPITKLFVIILKLFRRLFGILLAIEIFFIIKNRKNT